MPIDVYVLLLILTRSDSLKVVNVWFLAPMINTLVTSAVFVTGYNAL